MDYLQETKGVEAPENKKRHTFLWFLLFGIVFVALFLVIFLVFFNGKKDISNNLINYSSESNSVNKTNLNEYSNNINIQNISVCPERTYACYEPQGFFCPGSFDGNSFNPFCCRQECLKFESEEQFCLVRGNFYFEGNETHICNMQVYSPFNGAHIVCCRGIKEKPLSD